MSCSRHSSEQVTGTSAVVKKLVVALPDALTEQVTSTSAVAKKLVIAMEDAVTDEITATTTGAKRIASTSPAWPGHFIHFHDLGPIVGDLNSDGQVDIFDLSIMLHWWHKPAPPAPWINPDLNGDGIVNIFDLSILLGHWGLHGTANLTAGSPSRAPRRPRSQPAPRVSVLAYSSPMSRGARGLLALDAAGATRCELRFRSKAGMRAGPFDAALRGRRYLTYRWRIPTAARPGSWRALVRCVSNSGRSATARQTLLISGRGTGMKPIALATDAAPGMNPAARRPIGGGAAPCPARSRLDQISGYCTGSAAQYVFSLRPDLSHLGSVAEWWSMTTRREGVTPARGAVAWWAPGRNAPHGHVAYVEKITSKGIWLSEEAVYGTGMIDHAVIARTGAAAPTGYIYTSARPTGPGQPPAGPGQAPGASSLYVWPSDTTAVVGDTFTVDVRLSVTSGSVSTASADVNYDPATLSFVSAALPSDNGLGDTTWGTPQFSTSPGTLRVQVSSPGLVSADVPMALVTFAAIAPGSSTLSFASDSRVGLGSQQAIPVMTSAPVTIEPAPPPPAATNLILGTPGTPTIGGPPYVPMQTSPIIVQQGTQFDVPVYANITGGQVDAIHSQVSYPTGILSFVSSAVNSSAWDTTVVNGAAAGTVDVQIGASSAQSGSVLLTTITFQADTLGTATLSFTSSSQAADADQWVDTVVGSNNIVYTVVP
jgi:hypothetical protein